MSGERDENSSKRVLELLRSNCVTCHGANDPKAGLRLDRLQVDLQKNPDAAKQWQLVLSAIRDNEMPPAKEKQLTADDRAYLVKWIEAELERFVESSSADRPALRRKLTRIEYQNTMRDLLQIEMDFARDLPADPISSDGFSNDSRLLELTPVHLEAYLKCARSALQRVIVSHPRPEQFHHRFDLPNVSNWLGESHIASELGRQQQFLAKIEKDYPEQGEFLVRVAVEAKLQPNCGFPLLEVSVGYQPDTEILFREFPVTEVNAPGGHVFEFKGRIEDFPLPVRGQGKSRAWWCECEMSMTMVRNCRREPKAKMRNLLTRPSRTCLCCRCNQSSFMVRFSILGRRRIMPTSSRKMRPINKSGDPTCDEFSRGLPSGRFEAGIGQRGGFVVKIS